MSRRVLVLTTGRGSRDGWSRYSEGFVDGLRAAGWQVEVAEGRVLRSRGDGLRKCFGLLADVAVWRAAARRADLIHAMVEPFAPLAWILSVLSGKPFLVSVHGTYGDRRAYPPAVRWLYGIAFSRAAACLPVSRYTTSVFARSFRPRRTELVPGGVYLPSVSAVRRFPSGRPLLLSVGALKPRKGFYALIEAVALVRETGLDVECEIVGDQSDARYAERLVRRISELGLGRTVRLRGVIGDAELAALYASASLFVLAAEHDGPTFEGLGLVYLEAMSRGTPCIASRESGAQDVVEDGGNGFLVPPGEPTILAEAIRRGTSDPVAWEGLSVRALETVERFAWERAVERLRAVYESLIS